MAKPATDGFSPAAIMRALKNRRNAFVDALFRKRQAASGRAFAVRLAEQGVTFPCFAIAFNTPWVVDLLTDGWRRHCSGASLVVLNNSSDGAARRDIRRTCEQRGVPYLALPRNPEWSPNRSHGISMNWAYYNIVRPLRPQAFGFIDHDCIPVADYDFAEPMATYSVYGRPNGSPPPGRWNLWAGFCFFRFAETDGRAIDFKHRIEWRLDTGGGNWEPLYSRLDPARVGRAAVEYKADPSGPPGSEAQFIDGSFLHVGGASYRRTVRDAVDLNDLPARIRRTYLPGSTPLTDPR